MSRLTEHIVAALEMHGYHVLPVDSRKTCRRDTRDVREIIIAIRHFEINFCSVVSLREAWYRQMRALQGLVQEQGFQALPRHHIQPFRVAQDIDKLPKASMVAHVPNAVRRVTRDSEHL